VANIRTDERTKKPEEDLKTPLHCKPEEDLKTPLQCSIALRRAGKSHVALYTNLPICSVLVYNMHVMDTPVGHSIELSRMVDDKLAWERGTTPQCVLVIHSRPHTFSYKVLSDFY
jgi:hypothetical protein